MKLFNFTKIPGLYLLFQSITRIMLCCYALHHHEISLIDLPTIFLLGIINDLVSSCYLLPIIFLLSFIFSKLQRIYKTLLCGTYFCALMIFSFISLSEIVFWDEFGTRFNFIAVDYLIYTNEIIGTIKESLPYLEILSGVIIFALIISVMLRKRIIKNSNQGSDRKFTSIILSTVFFIASLLTSLLAFNFYSSNDFAVSSNKYAIELAKNGPYEFFSAYFNNTLDYHSFYPVIDNNKALEIVRSNYSQNSFLDEKTINRQIKAKNNEQKHNVIFITVESLSSEFMGKFGNINNITPNLDRLADESIFFTNLYAVGTRTVRGLEAITLAAPPTPGSSIIRRPNNQSLFNIGSVFLEKGYFINFVFGGYSYFDNLKNYFAGNDFNILDRSNLKTEEISFTNIWGVADEDILIKALQVADQNYRINKPFFSLIMTTSNHRPYTFPAGRIDLPSGGGRLAAVKYTDYAIGKFLELAQKKPWFDNTIFIITADHCASSAGKTELPINKYHIPLLIYAPKILKPKIINNLASQIDIAPTIFGLLNFSYDSKFFGKDILNEPANRAFISTYQLLGFMKDQHLIVLSPKESARTYKLTGNQQQLTNNHIELTEEAISFYQTAYDFYIQGNMQQ